MAENIIVGLDIGSGSVRMVAGELVESQDKEQLHILGAVEVPSQGMAKGGNISNLDDIVSSISICRERLERLIDMPIENTWIGVGNSDIICQASKGLISINKLHGEIDGEDIEKAIEQARTVATPSNYEILYVVPKNYSVDGQLNVKDPTGMTGVRLEVDTILIQAPLTHLRNLTKCIHRTSLDIDDLIFSILANAEVVLTPRQKELGVVVVNIGATTTSLAVYEEGDVVHIAVLPLGSDLITQDIALILKTSLDVAENIKVKYGTLNVKNISKKDEINLADEGAPEEDFISKKFVAEIIEARVSEIFAKINLELKKIGRQGLLPAGVILSGGGVKLEGMTDLAKKELKLPVSIGLPLNITSASEKINDPAFTVAIGLIKWGSEFIDTSPNMWGDTVRKIKNIFGKGGNIFKGSFKSIWK